MQLGFCRIFDLSKKKNADFVEFSDFPAKKNVDFGEFSNFPTKKNVDFVMINTHHLDQIIK
jgi:hypothetical protein